MGKLSQTIHYSDGLVHLNDVSSLDAPYRYNLLAHLAEKFELPEIIEDNHSHKMP